MILMETIKTLMLDEFEIVHWIKYLKRFDFQNKEEFHFEVFLIGIATKLILNDAKTKEPFEVCLTKIFNN
jgi:hypothetical protein